MNSTDEDAARVRTGVHGLDEVLHGGLPAGHVYLVAGAPGTGKTTLALQYLLAGGRDGEEGLLYITLSQSERDLRKIADSHGLDLSGVRIVELLAAEASDPGEAQSVLHTSEEELEALMSAIHSAVEGAGAGRMVIDSLSELRLVSSSLLRFRRSLLGLKNRLVAKGATTLLLDGMDEPDATRSVNVLAHGAVELDWRTPDYGVAHRRLRVGKLRGADFVEGYHDFDIRPGGLVLYPRLIPRESTADASDWELRSGLEALDELVGGALPGKGTTLIAGNTGVGKSVVATTFAHATAGRGLRTAVFLFEELEDDFRMRARALGQDLDASEVAENLMLIHQDASEISPGALFDQVFREVERGARLVVLDSLTGFFKTLPRGREMLVQFTALLNALKRRKVAVIMTLNHSGPLAEHGDAEVDASYISDNVILLKQYIAGSAIERSITAVKKRYGPHKRAIRRLNISADGVSVEPLPDSLTEDQAQRLRER